MKQARFFFAIIALLGFTTAGMSAQQYRVVDLGAQGAYQYIQGSGGGQQVGIGSYAGQPAGTGNRAMLWSGTAASFTDLTPQFYAYGSANDAENGVQVGTVASYVQALPGEQSFAPFHASIWRGSTDTWVDLNPAGYLQSWGTCIAAGQQGGYGKPTSQNDPSHALLWTGTSASVVDLSPYPGGVSSSIQACAPGVQVGDTNQHAAMWFGTAASYVDLHPAAYTTSKATGVAAEQTVGIGVNNFTRGLLWTGTDNATVIDLTPGAPYTSAFVAGTNGMQQVGWANGQNAFGSFTNAMLWDGSASSVVNLGAFLSGLNSSQAYAIEPDGTISGSASDINGFRHAILWIPTSPVVSAALQLDVNTLIGGNTAHLTVTLSAAAPAGGATVSLTSSDAAVSLPPSVVIPEGTTTVMIPVDTTLVSLPSHVLLTATYGGINRMAVLVVKPPVLLTVVSLANADLRPGASTTGTVSIDQPAPAGGAVVALSSNDPVVTVPASVVIPEGATSATFTLNVDPNVTTSRSVLITAQSGAVTLSALMFVDVPDVVKITKVQYTVSKKQLQVEATSTISGATLTVYDGKGALIGVLAQAGGGKSIGTFNLAANPGTIVIQSNFGGSVTAVVPNK